ncbi:MAG: hypothetical protein JNM27_01885 [Leptospirales bacterium]|nr:hypothetical protein [Leptospirales bacterium]
MVPKRFFLLLTGVALFWSQGDLFACGPAATAASYFFSQRNPNNEFCSSSGWDSDYVYSSMEIVSSQVPSLCSSGDANVRSWTGLAKQARQSDIAQLLSEFQPAQMKQTSLRSSKNTFAQYLATPAATEAREFLTYAKDVEAFTASVTAAATDQPWNWKPTGIDTNLARRLVDSGEKALVKAKDPGIKERYALQILRIRFYSGDFAAVIKDFSRFGMENAKVAPIKGRAQRYLAGALIRTGQKEAAALQLAELFINSADVSEGAAADFHRVGEISEEKLTSQAANSSIAAGLYLLKATHNPSYSLPLIKKAYELDPGQPLIARLLLREVAMIEENNVEVILGHEKPQPSTLRDRIEQAIEVVVLRIRNAAASLIGRPALAQSPLKGTEKDHASALAAWADRVIQDGKRTDLDLWRFNSAYLHFLSGDFDKTLSLSKSLSNKRYWGDKARVLTFLTNVTVADKIESKHEGEFLSIKDVLFAPRKDQEPALQPLRDYVFQVLSRKYRAQNDLAHSVLMDAMLHPVSDGEHMDHLGDSNSIEPFLAMIEKKDLTPFEKFGIKYSQSEINDVRDHLGSLYLREERYKEALTEFQKLPPKYLKGLNKTYVGKTGPLGLETVDFKGPKEPDWDKKSVAEALVRLSDAVAKTPTVEAYQQLANAQYNMTHFGKWWILTRRYKSWGGYYSFDNRLLKSAKQKAEKILTMTKDREASARAVYLLALIGDGELYLSGAQSDYSPLPAKSKERQPLYARLASYKGTKFYEDHIETCAEFQNFLAK